MNCEASPEGYTAAGLYPATVQPEMAPAALFKVAQTFGVHLATESVRYVELGSGQGVTLAALAATDPAGTYVGYDFSPEHIAASRQFARHTGLQNLSYWEADFTTLSAEAPPGGPFDVVALHGVWSWVSDDVREDLVRLIRRWLSPGGFLYISYNARPFWNALDPLRYVLRELLNGGVPLEEVRFRVDRWLQSHGSSEMADFWKKLRDLPASYLVHEFGGRGGTAQWPQDVEDQIATAGGSFLGQAQAAANYRALSMSGEAQVLFEMGEASGFARTARDISGAQSFRADVFHRGAPRITPAEIVQSLDGLSLRLPVGALLTDATSSSTQSGVMADLDCVADGLPKLVSDLQSQGTTKKTETLRMIFLALALQRADLGWPDNAEREIAVGSFNRAVLSRAKSGVRMPCLVCAKRRLPIRVTQDELDALAQSSQIPPRLSDCDLRLDTGSR